MASMTRQPENGRMREAVPATPQRAVEQAGDAGAEMLRGGAEVAHRSVDATAELAQRSGETVTRLAHEGAAKASAAKAGALAELRGRAARAGAAAAEAGGRDAAAAMQGGAVDFWRMASAGPGGLREMQAAVTEFYTEAMRSNLRMAQDMFRLIDPVGLLRGQQQMAHQMLDTMLAGQASLFGAAKQAAKTAAREADRPG